MSALNSLVDKTNRVTQRSNRGTAIPRQLLDSERSNSLGIVETDYFHFALPPHELVLENGVKLGPITVAYETYGTLNDQRSNAILILHALSGDAHAK